MLASTGAWNVSASSTREAEALLERREQHDRRVLVAPAQRPVVGAAQPARHARAPRRLAGAGGRSRRCAGPGCRARRGGSPGVAAATRSQMSSSSATFLRGARSPTTSANRVSAELRRPAPARRRAGGGSSPFGATTVFASHAGSSSRSRSRVAALAAIEPVAWSSDARYWRGRSRRLASADSWARVIVITSCTVRTVGSADAGHEVLRAVHDLRAGRARTAARSRSAPRARSRAARGRGR